QLRGAFHRRDDEIFAMVARFTAEGREAPTAYELLEALRPDHPRFDVNSVRPPLTRLRDAGRIVAERKRRCRITGHVAWTWTVAGTTAITAAAEPAAPAKARQPVLDLTWYGGPIRREEAQER